MFNKKLEKEIYGEDSEFILPFFSGKGFFTKHRIGLLEKVERLDDRVKTLEFQNSKLQALLNELIDHVYSEKKV